MFALVGLSPPHVAFTAQNTFNLNNLGNGQTIKFDNIVTNVGGRYSAGTGLFTTDISGMYAFTFVIRVFEYSHICWIDLVKNDQRVVISWAKGDPEQYGYENGGNFALIHLSKGDNVWLKYIQYKSFVCSIDDLSTFSGFLLYPD